MPRQPFATPGYYPQEPSGQFANPALFAKLDVDTLFYIFYYCQGTYLQCVFPLSSSTHPYPCRGEADRPFAPLVRRVGISPLRSSRSNRGASTSSTSHGSSAPTSRSRLPTSTSRESTFTVRRSLPVSSVPLAHRLTVVLVAFLQSTGRVSFETRQRRREDRLLTFSDSACRILVPTKEE